MACDASPYDWTPTARGRRLFTFVVHGKPPVGPAHRVVLTEAEQDRKRTILKEYQTKLSPVHDYLAEKFAGKEELFWLVRIE